MNQSDNNLQLWLNDAWTSPYALSVWVALKEKNLNFEHTCVNLASKQNREKAYQTQSATMRIPMLRDGDFYLTESSAITEYLEEVYAPPQYAALYPQIAQERAHVRQVQAWLRSDLLDIRHERSSDTFLGPRRRPIEPLSVKAQAARQHLEEAAAQWVRADSLSIASTWSIADVDLAMMLMRLMAHQELESPLLKDFVAKQWARPSVQSWVHMAGLAV